MQNDICKIPIVGHMVKGPDGAYHLDDASSVWAEIPASAIAAYLVDKLGVDAIFSEGAGA